MKKLLQRFFSRYLRCLGSFICTRPLHFIVFPCIISALLGTGIMMIKYERDLEKLCSYEEGRATKSKRLLESSFPRNTSKFTDPLRNSEFPTWLIVSVLNKNGANVLKKECLGEVEIIDKIVNSINLSFQGRNISFKEICAKVYENCFQSSIISLLPYNELIDSKKFRIKYPAYIDSLTYSYKVYASDIGGVTLDESGFIEEARALRIFYVTDVDNKTNLAAIEKWTNEVVSKLKETQFSHVHTLIYTYSLVVEEVKDIADSVVPLTAAVLAIIGTFSFVTSMTLNSITSKPWLGVAACISAGLALVSSFGLTFYCGVPTTDFNMGIPFLIIGTEVDDAYVLIATWRKTDVRESVKKRMGDTFADAGVSITITSITNLTAFCMGTMTPFLGVKYFCIHATVALAFTYVYMITFFGGCMALDGFREKKLLNAVTFQKCSDYKEKEPLEDDLEAMNEIITMKIFRDVIGKTLQKPYVKATVILCFFANFGVGFYGLSQLRDGIELVHLLAPNSETTESINTFYRYFTQMYGTLHIMVNEPIDYADVKVQKSLEETLQNFSSHPKIGQFDLIISWLKFYKIFQNNFVGKFIFRGYNLSSEQDFIKGLRDVFLKISIARQFENDIRFNENYTKIIASRFVLPILDVTTKNEEYELIRDVWRIADESKLNLTIHSPLFTLNEQGVVIRNVVFQMIWITTLLIFFIFFIFVPNLLMALTVSLSVIAALVETIGYMALWGLQLDIISMTVLVLSIGFSVNYPSHMACSFSLTKSESPDEKMRESLYHVGLPLLQGTLSTILGASLLAFKQSYVCKMFPKLMFLISIQTAFHSMFLLPVCLSLVVRYTTRWNFTSLLNCLRHKERERAKK